MLAIAPVIRSTPTKGLETLLDIMPIDIFLEREAVKTRLRTRELVVDKWGGIGEGNKRGHIFLLEKRLNNILDPVVKLQS